jgi:hypothetical protein
MICRQHGCPEKSCQLEKRVAYLEDQVQMLITKSPRLFD